MSNGIELHMPNIVAKFFHINAQRDLSEELIIYRVNNGHVLVFRVNLGFIGGRNSWIGDKEQMIGLIVVHGVGAVQLVELDRGFGEGMLINGIDNAIYGISDEDLSKIGSGNNTRSMRNVEQMHHFILS